MERICNGCIAIVAEKPRAAAKIAKALSGGKARKILYRGVPIWIFRIDGNEYVVIPSAGHLFSIDTDKSGIPVFEYRWIPRHMAEKGYRHLERFYKAFSEILPRARIYINACDYDIEGSLIGYMIIKNWGDVGRMRRMKFSSLVDDELRRSFRNLGPPDLNMVEAGLARHEMDWIWGINVSRALMLLFNKISGERRVLSAGRVQTPTLFEVVRNTIERITFVPTSLYNVNIYVEISGKRYKLSSDEEPFKRRSDAEKYARAAKSSSHAVVRDVKKETISYQPPYPFNLGDLQKEAYQIYRISPAKTLKILEDLYLDSLISYPRTNSQKLPPSIDHRGIIGSIGKMRSYSSIAMKILGRKILRPSNGPMEDPAHPAIYPTGEIPSKLREEHAKIYDLVVRRYLATFMDPVVVDRVGIDIDVAGRIYRLSGAWIVEKGWLDAYPFYRIEEKAVPNVRPGDRVKIALVKIGISYTRPETPHNKASLLRWMENQGIGTESTRAEIIETLFRRKYVNGSSATDLGLMVYSAIEKYFPDLSRVELTRYFEELMERIRRGELWREHVVVETKDVVGRAIERFLRHIENIDPREIKMLGVKRGGCPICGYASGDNGHSLCSLHEKAYKRLVELYREWARDGYEWEEYLKKIEGLKITGSAVREVISFLKKNGSRSFSDKRGI